MLPQGAATAILGVAGVCCLPPDPVRTPFDIERSKFRGLLAQGALTSSTYVEVVWPVLRRFRDGEATAAEYLDELARAVPLECFAAARARQGRFYQHACAARQDATTRGSVSSEVLDSEAASVERWVMLPTRSPRRRKRPRLPVSCPLWNPSMAELEEMCAALKDLCWAAMQKEGSQFYWAELKSRRASWGAPRSVAGSAAGGRARRGGKAAGGVAAGPSSLPRVPLRWHP